MKSSANYSAKRGDDGEKLKPQYEVITEARNPNRGQPVYKRGTLGSFIESAPSLHVGTYFDEDVRDDQIHLELYT